MAEKFLAGFVPENLKNSSSLARPIEIQPQDDGAVLRVVPPFSNGELEDIEIPIEAWRLQEMNEAAIITGAPITHRSSDISVAVYGGGREKPEADVVVTAVPPDDLITRQPEIQKLPDQPVDLLNAVFGLNVFRFEHGFSSPVSIETIIPRNGADGTSDAKEMGKHSGVVFQHNEAPQ